MRHDQKGNKIWLASQTEFRRDGATTKVKLMRAELVEIRVAVS